MSGFKFGSDRNGRTLKEAGDSLAKGRLPGRLGVVQDIVGHWAIPRRDRGWVRYGKATMDTFGTLWAYWESQKETEDQGREPCRAWLADHGYVHAYPGAGFSFSDFLQGSLSGVEYTTKKVKAGLRPTTDVLIEFELGEESFAYFVAKEQTEPGSSQAWWYGPYLKPDHRERFAEYVRAIFWEKMGSNTLLLSTVESAWDSKLQVTPLSDAFDFVSADDQFNNVRELASRCSAFLRTGKSRNLLMVGPPGTGKSTLARALGRELKGKTLILEHEALARMPKSGHRMISLLEPVVLIMNDVDRGAEDEHRGLLERLELEYRNGGKAMLTCLTVNDVERLDPALLRPGRIHEIWDVQEPSETSRAMILDYYVARCELTLQADARQEFMERSEGFAPADIREFCETVHAVGVRIALHELARIKKQREYYAGDKCRKFNERRNRGVKAERCR